MLREKHINIESIKKDLSIDNAYLSDANIDVVKGYYLGKITFSEMTGILQQSI